MEAAKAAGAHHVFTRGQSSLSEQVRELTGGHGADVIYDAVGQDSFAQSIAALAERGHLVSYGQASGSIGRWDIDSLAAKSATISRPNYVHYTDTREKIERSSKRLFEAIEQGILQIRVDHRYDLQQAGDAHRALEARQTTGSTILLTEHAKRS